MTQPEHLNELDPGPLLKYERERQKLSAEQVAGDLNIQLNKLNALESGEYEKMFSQVFARGYVRSYAKYLGLESEPLVERLSELMPEQEQPLPAAESLNVKMGRKRSAWPGRLFLIVLILLLWVIAYWFFADRNANESPVQTPSLPQSASEQSNRDLEPASAVQDMNPASDTGSFNTAGIDDSEATDSLELDVSATAGEPAPVNDSIEAQTVGDSGSLQGSVGATGTNPVQEAPGASNVSELVAADTTPQASPDTPAEPVASVDTLSLAFAQDCWVRVIDASGEVLLQTLKKAGTQSDVQGEAPFDVRLGNSAGVRAYVNGETISIPQSGAGNVVNFTASAVE